MKFVPTSVSRMASRSLLKLNANSPTILVVAGVVGFGATAVMAARATRKIDPIIENHHKNRMTLEGIIYTDERAERQDLVRLYSSTTLQLTRVYAPTIVVGTISAASILTGHRILKGRHAATMLAYSGLLEQFNAYRGRVAQALGTEREKDLYDGASLEWQEDPNHKGEYKLESKFPEGKDAEKYLRPWFDERNVNCTRDPIANYAFLKGVQNHMNNLLQIRGHVFLNDVFDALAMPRQREGQVAGWVYGSDGKDQYIDFGFMTSNDPHTQGFRDHLNTTVQLNFNIDGMIYDLI